MTVATDKLVHDISPVKTDSFKPVDQFWLFLKWSTVSGEVMYASLSEATVIFGQTELTKLSSIIIIEVFASHYVGLLSA